MCEMKKSNNCDKNCSICNEINCPDDYRIKCYGVSCQKCDKKCVLRDCGSDHAKEIKEDKFAKSHNVMERHFELFSNIEDILDIQQDTNIDPIRRARLEAARQMAFFYIEHPAEFDKFVMEFFLDKNQSDLAKERNMTRANVSKRIVTERGDKLKREIASLKQRNAAFSKMTTTELKVYQLCGEDGIFNVSNIAKQAGISRVTVYATLRKLREKYGINFTLEKSRKKKK